MGELAEYVYAHTERGECKCGKCIDRGDKPDPSGPTVDMVFVKVSTKGSPDLDEFKRLTKSHVGHYCNWRVDPFDGNEHNYIELGGWIGDQGLAMLYMALGVSLGLFTLLSPEILGITGEQAIGMAEVGFLSIQARPVEEMVAI